MKRVKFVIAIIVSLLILSACTAGTQGEQLPGSTGAGSSSVSTGTSPPAAATGSETPSATAGAPSTGASEDDDDAWLIRIVNPAGEELWSFTEASLRGLLQERNEPEAFIFSTINNWPAVRFYAAEGYSVESVLTAAGVFDTAQTVTFRAADGYEVSLTREQLLSPQYYYPHVGEDEAEAVPVSPVIAYRWREGADDIDEIRDDKPCFIFGQRTVFEHTNPAFVVGIAEIIVDAAPADTWPDASTFPLPGPIAEGETVKLQHPSYGLVKLHYTLDGSDPTPLSPMYNPSTYQPELNRPIPITEPVTIKVLVTGYGKNDSEIAVFEFIPVP